MRIEIAKEDDRMASSGSALLRSLQNDTLPITDLVVRESFQNSLDAALSDKDFVKIEVDIHPMSTSKAAPYFEGIEDNLKNRLPEQTTSISLKDTNTTGLTGEVKTSDLDKLNKSNIYKLIYGINMNQDRGDAGGSWGLGKTSFFRIGLGIVIYYTRISLGDGRYEERLAACLIEDEKSKDAIMPENKRGIAWWGDKPQNADPYEKSYPITDQTKIHELINLVGATPFTEDETGTAIIIPFVKEENIVLHKDDGDSDMKVYPWQTDLSESFRMAVKRWYTPRIMNKKYLEYLNQPFLMPIMNGELVTITETDITFNTILRLYNAALTGKTQDKMIKTEPVYLKQMGMVDTKEPVGHISYTKLTAEELGLINGSNVSPLVYLGDYLNSEKKSAGILAYSRKPGMVIEYSIDDPEWMKGVITEEDNFVLSFFVPNSDGNLHPRYQDHYETLENYLRDTETADHSTWEDKYVGKKKITIIKRTKAEVSKILATDFGESLDTLSSRRTSTLSRQIGQQFLPKVNFGKTGSRTGTASSSDRRGGGRTSASLDVANIDRAGPNSVILSTNISLPKKSEYKIGIEVSTTDRKLNKKKWDDIFKNTLNFPFIINEVSILSYNSSIEFLDAEKPYTDTDICLVNLSSEDDEVQIDIELLVNDETMQPQIKLQRIKKDAKEGD